MTVSLHNKHTTKAADQPKKIPENLIIKTLPTEILRQIPPYLDGKDACALSQTNHFFYELIWSNPLSILPFYNPTKLITSQNPQWEKSILPYSDSALSLFQQMKDMFVERTIRPATMPNPDLSPIPAQEYIKTPTHLLNALHLCLLKPQIHERFLVSTAAMCLTLFKTIDTSKTRIRDRAFAVLRAAMMRFSQKGVCGDNPEAAYSSIVQDICALYKECLSSNANAFGGNSGRQGDTQFTLEAVFYKPIYHAGRDTMVIKHIPIGSLHSVLDVLYERMPIYEIAATRPDLTESHIRYIVGDQTTEIQSLCHQFLNHASPHAKGDNGSELMRVLNAHFQKHNLTPISYYDYERYSGDIVTSVFSKRIEDLLTIMKAKDSDTSFWSLLTDIQTDLGDNHPLKSYQHSEFSADNDLKIRLILFQNPFIDIPKDIVLDTRQLCIDLMDDTQHQPVIAKLLPFILTQLSASEMEPLIDKIAQVSANTDDHKLLHDMLAALNSAAQTVARNASSKSVNSLDVDILTQLSQMKLDLRKKIPETSVQRWKNFRQKSW